MLARGLAADPQGLHRRLGREWDLVLALREWSWLELTFRLSRFEPGPAYAGSGRDAASALEVGAAVQVVFADRGEWTFPAFRTV